MKKKEIQEMSNGELIKSLIKIGTAYRITKKAEKDAVKIVDELGERFLLSYSEKSELTNIILG